MADETVATTGASSPGAADSSSASSSVATVASPETTAPAVSAETSTIADPKQYLRDELSKVVLPGQEPTPEQKAAQEKESAAKAEADKAAAAKSDADKTAEQKAAEQKAADEKAAAEKAEADKAAAAKTVDPLDKLGPLPAEKLAEALTATPELVTALEKAGVDKDLLFETCRGAAEAEQFHEAGLPTVESAKFAVENANHFYDIEEGFPTAGKDLDSFDKFMSEVMVPLSVVRDADGNPVPDPKNPGQFLTDGSVSAFMSRGVEYENRAVSKMICAGGIEAALKLSTGKDDDGNPTFATEQAEEAYKYYSQLQAAVDFYEEFRQNGYKMPTAADKKPVMSAEDKAEMDRLRARDQQVSEQEAKNKTDREQIYVNQVSTDTLKATAPFVEKTLNDSSLTDELKTKAGAEIWAQLKAKMDGFRTYTMQRDAYYAKAFSKGATEAQQKKAFDDLVSLNSRTMKNFLNGSNGILAKVLKDYGAKQISAQESRNQKTAAQVEADRMSSGARAGGGTNAKGVPTGAELDKKVMELAQTYHGPHGAPTASEIFRAEIAIKSGSAAA